VTPSPKESAVASRTRDLAEQRTLLRWYELARSFDPKLEVAHFLREPTRTLRYARKAARGVRRYGSLLKSVSGRELRSPFRHYWGLYRRFGHTIDDYFRYRLHDETDPLAAAMFLPERRLLTINAGGYRQLGVDYETLTDKGRFEEICHEHGFPAIQTIALVERGGVRWGRGRTDRGLPGIDLISKPVDRKHGAGIRLWRWDRGAYVDASGHRLAANVLLDRLIDDSRSGRLLIQPRVRPIESLASLARDGLCTARVVTSRPRSGTPGVQIAVLKMPTGSRLADNFAAGGIAAPVNLESGVIGAAVSKSVDGMVQGQVFGTHPDTGAPIAGSRIPDWDMTKKLCIAAHDRLREFHSIGWDVAITDRGPLLVEGNEDPDPVVVQQPGLEPLGRTNLIEHIMTFFDDLSTAHGLRAAPVHR
jgi:hypothetical protein